MEDGRFRCTNPSLSQITLKIKGACMSEVLKEYKSVHHLSLKKHSLLQKKLRKTCLRKSKHPPFSQPSPLSSCFFNLFFIFLPCCFLFLLLSFVHLFSSSFQIVSTFLFLPLSLFFSIGQFYTVFSPLPFPFLHFFLTVSSRCLSFSPLLSPLLSISLSSLSSLFLPPSSQLPSHPLLSPPLASLPFPPPACPWFALPLFHPSFFRFLFFFAALFQTPRCTLFHLFHSVCLSLFPCPCSSSLFPFQPSLVTPLFRFVPLVFSFVHPCSTLFSPLSNPFFILVPFFPLFPPFSSLCFPCSWFFISPFPFVFKSPFPFAFFFFSFFSFFPFVLAPPFSTFSPFPCFSLFAPCLTIVFLFLPSSLCVVLPSPAFLLFAPFSIVFPLLPPLLLVSNFAFFPLSPLFLPSFHPPPSLLLLPFSLLFPLCHPFFSLFLPSSILFPFPFLPFVPPFPSCSPSPVSPSMFFHCPSFASPWSLSSLYLPFPFFYFSLLSLSSPSPCSLFPRFSTVLFLFVPVIFLCFPVPFSSVSPCSLFLSFFHPFFHPCSLFSLFPSLFPFSLFLTPCSLSPLCSSLSPFPLLPLSPRSRFSFCSLFFFLLPPVSFSPFLRLSVPGPHFHPVPCSSSFLPVLLCLFPPPVPHVFSPLSLASPCPLPLIFSPCPLPLIFSPCPLASHFLTCSLSILFLTCSLFILFSRLSPFPASFSLFLKPSSSKFVAFSLVFVYTRFVLVHRYW